MRYTLPLLLLIFVGSLCLSACAPTGEKPDPVLLASESWQEVLDAAHGETVHMMMWMGDPLINAYMRTWVAPRVDSLYGVSMSFIPAQGNAIVSQLVTELEANASHSAADLVWINGESFYQLRQADALYGPFTQVMPNTERVAQNDPFISVDFQQPVDGMESPWGSVQFVMITDTTRVAEPPTTRAELSAWIQAHPGRFTLDRSFTGLTFLKMLFVDLAGGYETVAGPFDEALYRRVSDDLFTWLETLRPYFWREGASYPENVTELHRLYGAGIVDFTMSNNDGEVDNKVLQGTFPGSSVGFVPAFGSIRNTHYVGIPVRSDHKAAAMVVADFLLSPEAQIRKQRPEVWGDGTVLDTSRLSSDDKSRFAEALARRRTPAPAVLRRRANPEISPENNIRLNEDFRERMVKP